MYDMKKIQTSVVIVGSGWAGQRCAIELWEQGCRDILIVGDRKFSDPHTTQARWWINAALATLDEEDTPLIHAVDTFREWQFVAHPDLVELLADHAPSAIADLISWWANFHKEEDWETLTQRFFGAHSYRRTVFSGDETGLEMIKALSRKSLALGIPYLEDTYVYELLTKNGVAHWVLAKDKKTSETICIQAPSVVFATWWYANVYWRSSSRGKENFGDGMGIAFRAWAMIGDIELIQFHPTWLLFPEEKFGELVTEAVRWEWGRLYNNNGERFMKKYDPEKMELSTRDVVARANFWEIHQGRWTHNDGVYLDISHKSKKYILDRLPKMHSMILKYNNIDISEQPVEVAPTTHYTMWWIWFDPKTMETTIENFWVAWECSMWVHGANRLWWNSLMETMVFWKLVAQAIVKKWKSKMNESISFDQSLLESVLNEWWVDSESVLLEIRKNMWELAGIVRTEKELKELLVYLESVNKKIESVWIQSCGSDYENVMMANRLLSVVELWLLICRWALERKESRGAHYREDYPEMSNKFNKNFVHYMIDGEIISQWKDISAPSSRLEQGLEEFERTKNYGHSE